LATSEQFKGLMLIGLVVVAGMAVLGWVLPGKSSSSCPSSPASPCWTQVQNGFKSCTVPTNANFCTVAVTFSPAYSVRPFCCNQVWNGTNIGASTSSGLAVQQQVILAPQAINNTDWVNVPATETELYGQSNQRVSWYDPAISFTAPASGQLCMDFGNAGAGTATFTAQWSTDQATWTTLGDSNFNVTATSTDTVLCGISESLASSLTPATQTFFRIVGSDSTPSDTVGIGTVTLSLEYRTTVTITIKDPCAPTYTGLSASGVTLRIQCLANPATAVTATMNWWAGIPG
jgi:hypothetical protein